MPLRPTAACTQASPTSTPTPTRAPSFTPALSPIDAAEERMEATPDLRVRVRSGLSMPSEGSERRVDARCAMKLSCKVRAEHALRFMTARTENVSASGALLMMQGAKPLGAGETVEVGIAFGDRPILRSSDIVRATVVRVMPSLGDQQRVAVRFGARVAAAALTPAVEEQIAAA